MRGRASPASRRETLAGVVATILGCAYVTHGAAALAQDTDKSADPRSEPRDTVIIIGSQVDIPPDYPGGQVAHGGRVGILGNQDLMDVPFNVTSYTSEFIRDTQASSVADVLASDAAVRIARGFGNFQELY
ncbi:MAG TPA: Plug domain-containing protein, partial [Steroidobacteraceae bacterium]